MGSLGNLTSINLSSMRSLSDSAIVWIVSHCFKLKKINLNASINIKDDSIIAIAEKGIYLFIRFISNCSQTY